MQTILYSRVSTTDQTVDHQTSQAESAGFQIDQVICDDGVSGISTAFADRPQARRLFDLLRHGDVLLVRWVDRLGRDYDDVTDTIRRLMKKGIVVRTVINNFTFDGATDDPVQKAVRDALIAFMAATSQAQAEATKVAQTAGIQHAKNDPRKYRGKKPSYDRNTFESIKTMIASGSHSQSAIARTHGVSRQTVIRIQSDPTVAEAALQRWNL